MSSTTHPGDATVHPKGERAAGTAGPRSQAGAPRVVQTGHARRAVLALYSRLMRRSALLMIVGLAAYSWLEVISYRSAYPNGVSAEQFQMFADNPAVRIMSGVPSALDTAAGFAIWDAGWVFQLILAVWAILTTTRFLRGEEDLERSDLVLAAPVRSTRLTGTVLAVMAAAALLVGTAVTVTMVVTGNGVRGSVLLGLALAGVCATFASVGAVTSQLVQVRRRAAGLAAGVLGVAYVLRMVGNSTDGRLWVRWFTPLGWLDELRPYGDADLRALIPLIVVPILLAGIAIALRARRDVGAALLASETGRAPHLRLLGGPTAFAWRSNRATLVAWIIGLGAYAAIMGALITTMIDWLAQDEGYQRILAQMGYDKALTTPGFLSVIGVMLGIAVALQVSWRMGAARAEEESGRVEAVLARPVTRLRWLGGHASLALLGGTALLAAVGTTVWLGAAVSGSHDITWADSMRSAFNTLPVVVLVGGLAVFMFGVLPRLTVAVPVTVIVVAYVASLLGPALHWPGWALDLSPFTHLAAVPAEPWAATSGILMTCLGLALGGVGFLAFHRRDIVGG